MVLHVHVLPESVAKKIGTYHNLHWHFFLHISNLKLESDFFYTEYTAPYMKEMGFLGDFFYENLRVYCPGTWILLWTCSFPRCVIDLKKNTVFFSVHTGRAQHRNGGFLTIKMPQRCHISHFTPIFILNLEIYSFFENLPNEVNF